MSIRCASFRAHPKPGHEDGFTARVRERLVPLWARFPGAGELRVSRRAEGDGEQPRPDVVPATRHPTRDAIATASEGWHRSRAVTADDVPLPIGEVAG